MGVLRQWPKPTVQLPKSVTAPFASGTWPANVAPGDLATAAQYNALVSALASWGGNVAANQNSLTDVTSVAGLAASKTLRLSGITRVERYTDNQNYIELNCEALPAVLKHSLAQLEIDCQTVKATGALNGAGFVQPYRTVGTNGMQLANTDYHVACTPGCTSVTLPAAPFVGQVLLL
jgi:hypothetical protein